jgi:hypothetical protein
LPALDKRWNNGNERFLVPPDVFDPKRYRVDAVAQRDAKAYILQHHYKRDAAGRRGGGGKLPSICEHYRRL